MYEIRWIEFTHTNRNGQISRLANKSETDNRSGLFLVALETRDADCTRYQIPSAARYPCMKPHHSPIVYKLYQPEADVKSARVITVLRLLLVDATF